MLRARWYKVINDLFGNKTRTLLIVLSMSVGLFALGIILSARTILSDGLAESFATIYPSSGTVRTIELFDEDFIESVRKMDDVQEADARRSISVRMQTKSGEWKNLTIFVFADYEDIRVNKVTLQSGAWPPPEHEILIERAALSVIEAQVGDMILIRFPSDVERRIRIAGLAYDPAQLPAQIDGTPYGYITFDTLEWFGESYGFNELHVIANHPEDKDWAQQVVNRVKDKAENSGYTIPLSMTAEPGQLPMNDVLQGILLLMGLLGVLSLFLSIFLVVNTVSALLTQQKRQIGVMKAVGGGTLQILGMYLVMVFSYGVMALMIAIPFGMYGARKLSSVLAVFFNFDLYSMDVPPQTYLIQAAVGLILPVLASLVPFLSNLRISAAEAMSSYTMGKGRFGKNWIDHFLSGANLWFVRKLSIRSILLSVRNTFRNKGRLTLTLITLTLGSATFISVFNVRASLSSTVEDMIKWFNCDTMFALDRSYRADKVQSEAESIPGVTKTDVWIQLPTRLVRRDESESGMIYMFAPTVRPDSLIVSPSLAEGRWLAPGDENAVVVPSALLIDEPELELGGDIVLKIDGDEHVFKIVGTFKGMAFLPIVYVNYDYITKITNRTGEADAVMIATQQHDSVYVDAVTRTLEERFNLVGIEIGLATTINTERRDAEASFDAIVALLLLMAILLALVGGLGLMGTMSINVLERTREIGVLRAIGAPNRSVASVFVLEGIIIGLMSWAMGAAVAIPMSRGLNQALGQAVMGVPLTYSYSLPGLWLWLVIVILLSILASFIPARTASRLTVREVLAYE
ncbi:MAG: ABC transporter permease [Anaerolineales bacterium]|jgi:putative ABC transport system permease protein|uniref:ABC transporter permease n=1 Tax=Candidatus Villigracilis affinis TaxID=3140682 RepID=UPI001D7CF9AE|nr:ABC transporter permease [Anaerolineales bacterium]MBK9604332.1 ABC transporter permease [Anaerolineales bacterium]MBL0344760.1 ABC transporter permease [Anaerolineales bacterium]